MELDPHYQLCTVGPKEILCFTFVPGVMSYSPGAFRHYVRVTALEFSCKERKPQKKNVSVRNRGYPRCAGLDF